MPHNTSPSGFPAVKIAFDTSVPVSPDVTTLTFAPVAAVNASKIPSVGVNASYASSVTSFGVASVEVSDDAEEHADAVTTSIDVTITRVNFMRYLRG
jgi:hypothetical protein